MNMNIVVKINIYARIPRRVLTPYAAAAYAKHDRPERRRQNARPMHKWIIQRTVRVHVCAIQARVQVTVASHRSRTIRERVTHAQ